MTLSQMMLNKVTFYQNDTQRKEIKQNGGQQNIIIQNTTGE
jgi:hypothetical protein